MTRAIAATLPARVRGCDHYPANRKPTTHGAYEFMMAAKVLTIAPIAKTISAQTPCSTGSVELDADYLTTRL